MQKKKIHKMESNRLIITIVSNSTNIVKQTIPPPSPGGFPPKMGRNWIVKNTEKAKAKTLAYIYKLLIIKSILLLVKEEVFLGRIIGPDVFDGLVDLSVVF